MSTPISREEFVSYMELLQSKVDAGFAGVHRRQDTTNGRIEKAEIRLNRVERTATRLADAGVKLSQIKGKLGGAAAAGATILAVLKWAYETFGHIAPKP